MGRNWLVNELLRAGLEIATPLRDHGVDLIAYLDVPVSTTGEASSDVGAGTTPAARFTARPIQVKAVRDTRFTIDEKYAKFPDLLIVHIWHLDDPTRTTAYAMTYPQMLALATQRGWTATKTWQDHRYYNLSRPSSELVELLEPFRMSPQRWLEAVRSAPGRL